MGVEGGVKSEVYIGRLVNVSRAVRQNGRGKDGYGSLVGLGLICYCIAIGVLRWTGGFSKKSTFHTWLQKRSYAEW